MKKVICNYVKKCNATCGCPCAEPHQYNKFQCKWISCGEGIECKEINQYPFIDEEN